MVKYSKGKLILRESARGGGLFVIVDGSVRVFTQDIQGTKIPSRTLIKGDYFCEQALLGKANKTRNAYVEGLTDTTLIKVDEKCFSSLLYYDYNLKEKLEERRFKQALHTLSLSTGFYSEVESIVSNIKNPTIIEFRNNEYIFKYGDKADNVYVIFQGKVKLLIPDKSPGVFSIVMLNRGQLFGELGVIRNAPRAASAIAHSNLRLLSVDGDYFKTNVSKNPQLRQVMSTLQQTYQIPMRGMVEQYLGNVQGMGNSITNIYKLNDGRIVVSAKIINQDIFTMTTANVKDKVRFLYKNGLTSLELDIVDNHIVGINANGIWNNLPNLCQLLLDGEVIEEAALEHFELTGVLRV